MAVDTTYGSGGRLDLPLGAADTAVDASGKLLAAGYFGAPESRSGALWRFNPDGSPDPTFNRGGLATLAGVGPDSGLEWNAVLPLPDSRVVVAGIRRQQLNDGTQRERPVLARYNADGTLDKSFGGEGDDDGVLLPAGGTSDGMIADLARLPDGRILAGGNVVDQPPDDFYDVALWRFNADGTPDATFGAGGFRQQDVEAEDYLRAVAAAPDGSFFINDQHGVFAFKADGTLRGRVSDPAAFHGVVAPTPDGKFVVATVVLGGTDSNPRFTTTVRRYLADGTPDPGFGSGPGGGTTLAIGERGDVAAAVAVLPGGGTLVAAGSLEENYAQHSTLVRLAPDGALDSAFGVNGVFTEPFLGGAGPLLPLAGGRLLIVGRRWTGRTPRRPPAKRSSRTSSTPASSSTPAAPTARSGRAGSSKSSAPGPPRRRAGS